LFSGLSFLKYTRRPEQTTTANTIEITTIIVEVDISVVAELEVGVDVAVDAVEGLGDEVETGEGELKS
jgi:hypothetical protein